MLEEIPETICVSSFPNLTWSQVASPVTVSSLGICIHLSLFFKSAFKVSHDSFLFFSNLIILSLQVRWIFYHLLPQFHKWLGCFLGLEQLILPVLLWQFLRGHGWVCVYLYLSVFVHEPFLFGRVYFLGREVVRKNFLCV